jgi:hypothetical protein
MRNKRRKTKKGRREEKKREKIKTEKSLIKYLTFQKLENCHQTVTFHPKIALVKVNKIETF